MNIIENEIKNIRNKVDTLKTYGPKILKNSSRQQEQRIRFATGIDTQSDRLMSLVQSIADDVVALALGNKDKAKLGYSVGQSAIKIEELL